VPGSEALGQSAQVHSYVLKNSAEGRAPFFVMPGLNVEISASQIREQVRESREAFAAGQQLLPAAVFDFIRSHGLYR
jgi:hypothetical protein